MPPSAPRRATAALTVVIYLTAYILFAWYLGAKISYQSSPWLQLAYYFFAGILWVPGAFWLIKKIYKSS